ncbi:MAG: phasin family protein, partial [Rubrivivax sp.]
KIGEVTGRMSAMAGDVTAKAGQHWDKLESIFEQRTAKAMNKLGVPTAKDVDALIKRVDQLAVAVARLSKSAPPKASAKTAAKAAPKAPARKTVKRAVPRKRAG